MMKVNTLPYFTGQNDKLIQKNAFFKKLMAEGRTLGNLFGLRA